MISPHSGLDRHTQPPSSHNLRRERCSRSGGSWETAESAHCCSGCYPIVPLPQQLNQTMLTIEAYSFFLQTLLSTLFYPRLNDSNCWTRMNDALVFILFFKPTRALNFVIVGISTRDFLGVVVKVSQQQGFVGKNYWGGSCPGIHCFVWRELQIIRLI